ncbi:hypothetical protein BC826DRAFT_1187919 [Russula brevipes]|nr:hypothetical protein BC826DRAFT_1187919 [Russula brevipes]
MSTRTAPNKELIMGRVAECHPNHAQNTSSISLSSTHSDTTVRFLHESDVQGTMFYDVLLATSNPSRIESDPPRRNASRSRSAHAPQHARADFRSAAEVLARIFHLVALAESSRPGMGSLRWIGITHDLGWRVNTTWIAETLARARNAPLAIDLFGAWNAETLSMFAAHFAHTHEFRLRGLVTPQSLMTTSGRFAV